MKISPFNIAARAHDGRALLYNTLTRALCAVPADIALALAPGRQDGNVQSGEAPGDDAVPSGLPAAEADLLASLGYIVGDGIDQLAEVRARMQADAASTEALCLMVAPTMACNLACPYCYEREVKHPGLMDDGCIDELVRFIERERDMHGYRKVKVGWYGGEPLLGMDVIERLTARFGELGMEFTATMTSNLALCDEAMVERIAACGISSVLTTIDGIGSAHDTRRPALDGESTFERIRRAIEMLAARHIVVRCLCNLEEGNLGEYRRLIDLFAGNAYIEVLGAQVFDYCGFYGKAADFTPPAYTLIDNPFVMARLEYDRFRSGSPRAFEYEALLSPIRLFCGRQLDGYHVIDERGNIYECDGDIGYADRAIGTVRDDAAPRHAPHDPTADGYCAGCAFVPLCLGNCRWTRDHSDMKVCLPLRWVLGDYLADWCAAIGNPVRTEGAIEVLNEAKPLPFHGPFELWA